MDSQLMDILEKGTETLEEALEKTDPNFKTLSAYERSIVITATHIVKESRQLQDTINKGWSSLNDNEFFINEETLRNVRLRSRKFSYASPLAVATVETYQLLVHSGKRTIKATDDNIDAVIQQYVELNGKAIFNYLPRLDIERLLWTDSRVFYIHFTNDTTDEVKTRFLKDSNEITAIIYNPNDSSEVWLYVRTFIKVSLNGKTSKQLVYVYPDVEFIPDVELMEQIETDIKQLYNDAVFKWENPLQATIINNGVPRLYPILTWIQCYESLLNMVATVYSAISAIALVTRTKAEYVKKVSKAVGEVKHAKDNSGSVGNIGNNLVLDGDVKTLNAKSALLAPADLDVFLYQINMVTHLPPHAYGRAEPATGLSDGQNSNELTRLAIQAEQLIYEETERDLINYRLIQAIKRGSLSSFGKVEEVYLGEDYYTERIVWNEGIDGSFSIVYPPVRTQDIQKLINARISAHTLDNKIPNSDISTPKEYYADVFSLLGRQDLKERLESIPDEWSEGEITTPATEALAKQTLYTFANQLKEVLATTDSGRLAESLADKLESMELPNLTDDTLDDFVLAYKKFIND